jgi:hypothetical protein
MCLNFCKPLLFFTELVCIFYLIVFKHSLETLIERFGRVKSTEQGAATSVWAAVGSELDGKGGLYLEDCVVSIQKDDVADIYKTMFGYMPYAVNPESVNKLWDISEKLTKEN